jgi:hypothetical protein
MKARRIASRVSVCVAFVLGATAVVAACLDQLEVNTLLDVQFDGSSLGACEDGATRTIPSSECPGACSGKLATAICQGTSFSECSCIPSTAVMCDSGCCAAPGYVPIDCKGKSAILDPSEGLCDADNGYLLCNGTCFASFSCELTPGYTLEEHDAGHHGDAGPHKDAGKPEAGGDASPDATDASDGSTPDAPADGPSKG